jgi:hypothetical protein
MFSVPFDTCAYTIEKLSSENKLKLYEKVSPIVGTTYKERLKRKIDKVHAKMNFFRIGVIGIIFVISHFNQLIIFYHPLGHNIITNIIAP